MEWIAVLLLLARFGAALGAEATRSLAVANGAGAETLGAASSYSWSAIAMQSSAQTVRDFRVEGATEKDGPTSITLRFGDRTIHGYLFGNKAFVTSPDTNWKDIPEMRKGESPGQFMERMISEVALPARQIRELTSVSELRKDGETIVTTLPPASASALAGDRKTRRSDAAELKNASGDARLWTKDGAITKYELTLRGKRTIAGQETDFAQTTTVEIKELGTAKVEVPERVKEKLGMK